MIKQNPSIFILVFATAFVLPSCTSSISYRSLNLQRNSTARRDIFQLGACTAQVDLSTYLDDKRIFYVILSFGKTKCNTKLSELELSLDDFTMDKKQFDLKEIRVSKWNQGHRLSSQIDTVSTSLANLTLDTSYGYELDYSYTFWGKEPPPKRFQVKLNTHYEVDGEKKFFSDSLIFIRHKELHFWR